jgi:hypothetical protein
MKAFPQLAAVGQCTQDKLASWNMKSMAQAKAGWMDG